MKPKFNIIRWVPAALWMMLILSLSHQDANESHSLSESVQLLLKSLGIDYVIPDILLSESVLRKCAHFIEYFVLALFLSIGWHGRGGVAFSILLASVFAGLDEFHQSFIPGRSSSVFDVLLDVVGAIGGAVMYFFYTSFKRWLKKEEN